MKKKVKILVLGIEPKSDNYGCVALAYSFFEILKNISIKENIFFEVNIICSNEFSSINYDYAKISCIKMAFKKLSFWNVYFNLCKEVNFAIDFSEGDSFTDIYGMHRFYTRSLLKYIAQINCKTFLLGPQTIGPFNKKITKKIAKKIVLKTDKVFARDRISYNLAKNWNENVFLTSDIAFNLPAIGNFKIKKYNSTVIGINVSGLLYNGGYNQNNDFKLKVSYKDFIHKLVENLCDEYDVHLISHVISRNQIEDDYRVCELLHKKYKKTILAPCFHSPSEAKSYMSNVDVLIGSRMHATIGALSMGVPIIAISYSRKFEGLYDTIDYPYTVNVRELDEKEALIKINKILSNLEHMKIAVNKSLDSINALNDRFICEIIKCI